MEIPATSFCPFCNTNVPVGHVITCPKCLGPLHCCNGVQVCSQCGLVIDKREPIDPTPKTTEVIDAVTPIAGDQKIEVTKQEVETAVEDAVDTVMSKFDPSEYPAQ